MTTAAAPNSNADSSVDSVVDVPKLGVRHLILWTTCAAISLAFWKYCEQPNHAGSTVTGINSAFDGIRIIIACMIAGLTISSALLWAWCQVIGPRFPRQPGHYILGFTAVMLVGSAPLALASRRLTSIVGYRSYPETIDDVPQIVLLCLIWSVVLRVMGFLVSFTGWRQMQALTANHHWRLYFLVMMAFSGLTIALEFWAIYSMASLESSGGTTMFAFTPFSSGTGSPYALLQFYWISRFIIIDREMKLRRDWLHWVGVALIACELLMYLPLLSFGLNL